jgi:hypothetical protein
MIRQLVRSQTLAAQSTMINGTVRITGDLGHFTVFCVNQDTATPVTHAAVAFNHGIETVDGHFFFYIREYKISQLALL